MLLRFTVREDEEEWEIEEWEIEELYGNPQHETSESTREQELYGAPQHDVPDERLSVEFDPDFAFAVDWFDYPQDTETDSHQRSRPLTER